MREKKIKQNKGVIIYQAKNGAIELRGDFTRETLWATQVQIASIFAIERSVITKHIRNIYKEKELEEKATSAKIALVQTEGERTIERDVEHYNLDVVLSVGYRVNSKTATEFRKWATKTLRKYIVDGYAINKNRIAKNYAQFLSVVEDIKKLLPAGSSVNAGDAVELISLFADTWLSLDAYDRELLSKGKLTKKKVDLTGDKISKDLFTLRKTLIEKGEATDIFGSERSAGAVSGIVGNVMQTFGGNELYPTVEEKAAHLLYFMVKNHPFEDKTPPMIILEEARYVEKLKVWLTENPKGNSQNGVYFVSTGPGSGNPTPQVKDKSEDEAWKVLSNKLTDLGVKKILMGGMQFDVSEFKRDWTGKGPWVARCVGIALSHLSKDKAGKFEVELSALTQPRSKRRYFNSIKHKDGLVGGGLGD
ncbi:MAG: virulence protein RhuM/Fic/DOC family protein [Patescibacteria group bacterium]